VEMKALIIKGNAPNTLVLVKYAMGTYKCENA